MSKYRSRKWAAVVLGIPGWVLVVHYGGWLLALGIMLAMTSNNLDLRTRLAETGNEILQTLKAIARGGPPQ